MDQINPRIKASHPKGRRIENRSHWLAQLALSLLLALSLDAAADHAEEELFELSLDELLDIEIVSASKRSESIFDAPAAVFVITAEDIRRSGVVTLPEALRLAPGVEVAQIDGSKWAVSIRGYNLRFSNKLLVLIDGRAVYSPVFSGVFWDAQDTLLSDIDRIEVVRGPGATLWGANAVNGVINVITKNAADTSGLQLNAALGSQERGTFSARWGGSLGERGDYRVFAKHFERESNRLLGLGNADDDWRQARVGFRVDASVGASHSVQATGEWFNVKAQESAYELSLVEPFRTLTENSQDAEGYNLFARWENTSSPESVWAVQAYVDEVDRVWSIANIDRTIFDVSTEYQTSRFPRQNIVAGVGYRLIDDKITPGSAQRAGTIPVEREEEVFNLFAQNEIALVPDRLLLTLGSKFELNDFTGWEIQPNARLLWKPASSLSVWTSISRAVRTPVRSDRDYQILFDVFENPLEGLPPAAVFSAGNPDSPAEELLAVEAGVKLRLSPSLLVDLATYWFDYDKLRSSSEPMLSCLPSGTALPACLADQTTLAIRVDSQQANTATAETRGLELSIDWRPRPELRVQANYSYFNGSEQTQGIGFVATESDTLGTAPEHQASLRLAYIPESHWETDLWLRYVDDIESITGTPIDRYTTLDARLAWLPTQNVELALVGKGLFNDAQAQFVSVPVDIPFTEIERSVFLQFRISF
ncbi:MAG: TonB-dependent receptor [Pseudomonadota bacterium]